MKADARQVEVEDIGQARKGGDKVVEKEMQDDEQVPSTSICE